MKKQCAVFAAALILLSFGISTAGKRSEVILTQSRKTDARFPFTAVLDAGHGGEDGGAVAPDGTAEKNLNLQITDKIAAYFELFGVPYVCVRTSDRSVCDDGLSTVRERKRSDIHNRYALINSTPDACRRSLRSSRRRWPF